MLHGVDDNEGGACIGVGQVACVALSQHMQRAGLVQVAQHSQVFRPVLRAGVCLKSVSSLATCEQQCYAFFCLCYEETHKNDSFTSALNNTQFQMIICAVYVLQIICAVYALLIICAVYALHIICAVYALQIICAVYAIQIICAVYALQIICAVYALLIICAVYALLIICAVYA